jgi:hypothetical protein
LTTGGRPQELPLTIAKRKYRILEEVIVGLAAGSQIEILGC